MGDEEVGEIQLLLEVVQQLQDARLDADVQRAGDLVADDELGLQRESPRNADSLSLAARELMGETAEHHRVQIHLLHEIGRSLQALSLVGAYAVGGHGLGEDGGDGQARIQ